MALNDTDLLIIYCCLGGGVGLILVLLLILYCRRYRNPRPAVNYRTINGDEPNERRKHSHVTLDSAGAGTVSGGGGDLADYLQNLVDGMEKGRNVAAGEASPHRPHGGAKRPSNNNTTTNGDSAMYRGGDASLLTIVPSSTSAHVASSGHSPYYASGGGGVTTIQRETMGGPSDAPRGFPLLGPTGGFDHDGGELSEEKVSGIQRWREQVARETQRIADDPSIAVAIDEQHGVDTGDWSP